MWQGIACPAVILRSLRAYMHPPSCYLDIWQLVYSQSSSYRKSDIELSEIIGSGYANRKTMGKRSSMHWSGNVVSQNRVNDQRPHHRLILYKNFSHQYRNPAIVAVLLNDQKPLAVITQNSIQRASEEVIRAVPGSLCPKIESMINNGMYIWLYTRSSP